MIRTAHKHVHVMLRRVIEHVGSLQALDKPLNDKDKLAPKAVWKEKSRLLRLLGWDHWAKRLDEQFVLAFPKDFTSL